MKIYFHGLKINFHVMKIVFRRVDKAFCPGYYEKAVQDLQEWQQNRNFAR